MSDRRKTSESVIRRAKACNVCRKKKTKCDGARPICTPCKAFNLSCSFHDKVRRSGFLTENDYIQHLEARLRELENEKNSAQGQKTTIADKEAPRPNYNNCNVRSDAREDDSIDENQKLKTDGVDDSSQLLKNPREGMRFFGASSWISIVSPQGAEWLERRTGNRFWHRFAQNSASQCKLVGWAPRALHTDFHGKHAHPIPGRDEAVELAKSFLDSINIAMPLFDPSNLWRRVERQFSWNPDESPGWWAAFNIVLAFGYRERAQDPSANDDCWRKCLGHVRNALDVVSELFLCNADLVAVQAMLGLALFFQSTPNPQPLFMFTAAAIRLLQSIGLHKSNSFGLPPEQIEERRRVFWIALILDADISHRTGRPPAQDTSDFDTSLPTEFAADSLGVIEVNGIRLDLFNSLARFSLILQHIYEKLYTTSSQKKSRDEIRSEIAICEEELRSWQENIPIEFRPSREFKSDSSHPCLPYLIWLHFAYHSCYANLQRAFSIPGRLDDRNDYQNEQDDDREASLDVSTEKMLQAARSAIDLISQIDHFGACFRWSVVSFTAAATVCLFSHIIMDPSHARAASDIHMIHRVVELLAKMAAEEPNTYVDCLLTLCSDFETTAQQTLRLHHGNGVQVRTVNPISETSIYNQQPQDLRTSQERNEENDAEATYASLPLSMDQDYQVPGNELPMVAFPTWNWQDMIGGIPPVFDPSAFLDLANPPEGFM